MENINSTMNLYRQINKNNHATSVIDEFFAARVAQQKGLRPSARVSRLNKIIFSRLIKIIRDREDGNDGNGS
jgi:hypothetical protein